MTQPNTPEANKSLQGYAVEPDLSAFSARPLDKADKLVLGRGNGQASRFSRIREPHLHWNAQFRWIGS
jgi:hypothetical protein